MSTLDAIILGLVQGLTEFLPISSSGHLVLGQHLLNFEGPNLTFDIVLHLGSLSAVLVYFRRDIQKVIRSVLGKGDPSWNKVAWLILWGTIPTGLIGVLFKEPLEGLFESVRIVAIMLFVTGLLLFASDRIRKTDRPLFGIRVLDALLIGVVQGLSIIPGISRSGSTIATGLFLKIEADAAARFSFLLSIPAILGAVALEGKNILGHAVNGAGVEFIAGFVAAAISGWMAIKILMEVLKRKRLWIFAIYCWIVAGLTLLFIS